VNLTVTRSKFGMESTLGKLAVDGVFECYTLEDQVRDGPKVPGETAIPEGTYEIQLRTVGGFHQRYKARFPSMHKGMLWLQSVPGFEFILIHCGNTHDDTAGCLLVGAMPYEEVGEYTIGSSKIAYKRLYPKVVRAIEAGERVTILVTREDE